MAAPLRRDLEARRNAPFAEVFRDVTDTTTGLPFDFTGSTVKAQVRLYEGQPGPALLTLAQVGSSGEEGLYASDDSIEIYIDEVTLALLPEGAPGAKVVFHYDLIVDTPTVIPEVWACGALIVHRGVTSRLTLLTGAGGAFLVSGSGALLTAG